MNKIMIANCPVCKIKNPVSTQGVYRGKGKNKVTATIAYCAVCETVLNLEEDLKLEYVGKEWLKENGWEIKK